MTTFLKANKSMGFMKPELRLFLTDHYSIDMNNGSKFFGKPRRIPQTEARRATITQSHGWVPKNFISFMDIFNSKWSQKNYEDFFHENFYNEGGYDIIECRSDQIALVTTLCEHMGVYPELLIVHSVGKLDNFALPADKILFFIIKGDKVQVDLPRERNDRELLIYHPETSINFSVEGELMDDTIPFQHYSEYKLPWNHPLYAAVMRLKSDPNVRSPLNSIKPSELSKWEADTTSINHRFREIGGPADQFEDAEIVHFGIRGEPDKVPKARYVIYDGNYRVADPFLASLIVSGEGVFTVENIKSNTRSNVFLIVHGKAKVFQVEVMEKLKIFFPDMSQSEIDIIWKNHEMFYGNDREYNTGLGTSYAKELYFHNGFTFAEQILNLPRQKKDLPEPRVGSIYGLSYIDNYLKTLVRKTPNGLFELMLTKFAMSLRDDDPLFNSVSFTRSLLNVVQDRVKQESKLATQRRTFLLNRIEALTKNSTPIEPYFSEKAIGDPILEEEEKYRKKIDSRSYDPLTRPRKAYSLPPNVNDKDKWHKFVNEDYIIVGGEDYGCIISNCGFVVLDGSGEAKISGTVHSLIVIGHEVKVTLDNVSRVKFDPETYLFIENGSIFDTIQNYRDNMSERQINQLEDSISIDEFVYVEPNVDVVVEPQRSVIKNLYCRKLPDRYLTAEIDNIVELR